MTVMKITRDILKVRNRRFEVGLRKSTLNEVVEDFEEFCRQARGGPEVEGSQGEQWLYVDRRNAGLNLAASLIAYIEDLDRKGPNLD